MLKKKQVISFMKILQIPTNQTPEEIEQALRKAGWNAKDAKEAVAVLKPEDEGEEQVVKKPQVVAQMSKPSEDESPEAVPDAEQKEVPPPLPEKESKPPEASPAPAVPEALEESAPEPAPPAAPPVSPPQPQPEPIPAAEAQSRDDGGAIDPSKQAPPKRAPGRVPVRAEPSVPEPPQKQEPKKELPSFAPTQIPQSGSPAIVHEAPVNPGAMSQQMFRTDDRLSAETLSGLLGIDVDVKNDDITLQRSRRNPTITFAQLMIILVSSITLAFAALLYGMYLFEVGPFHPTVDAFKAFSLR